MRMRPGLRAIALGAIGIAIGLSPAWGTTLKVGGTGAASEMLRRLAPAFKADSGIDLEVIPGLGTSGGNNATIDGKLGMAFSGRDLRDKEKAAGLKSVGNLRTPFGLATSRATPERLKSTEIAALYRR